MKISRKFSLFMSIFLICSFVFMIGFSPSMTRAGIVALLSLLMWFFGRKTQPLFLLMFVAGLTILVNPGNVFDLGWQLSFASFFGVMILAPTLKQYFIDDEKSTNLLKEIFFETASAQIMTIPLSLITFGTISLISIPANMLILPFIPLAMSLTFLVGVFGDIIPIISVISAFFDRIILKCSIDIINYLAGIPAGIIEVDISLSVFIIMYIIIFILCAYIWRKTKIDLKSENIVA